MNIVVLNGSPKGDSSVTLQYIRYLKRRYKDHSFTVYNIARDIRAIENNRDMFDDIIHSIDMCDCVFWAFPLYVFSIHSSLQRFIEMIFERGKVNAFNNKYGAILCTSIHFFDSIAIDYVQRVCGDLGMRYHGYISFHMYDLKSEKHRVSLNTFFDSIARSFNKDMPTITLGKSHLANPLIYTPHYNDSYTKASFQRITLVVDEMGDKESNLDKMINQFTKILDNHVDIIELSNLDINGGCLGCLKCGYDYTCIYEGRDDFIDMYRSRLMTSDIIVFAGELKYRHLSSLWKTFFDRSFFNTHSPTLQNKQIGFIISGDLKDNKHVVDMLSAYVQWQGSNLVDIVSDQVCTSTKIDEGLFFLANRLVDLSQQGYNPPQTFTGIAGMKIFRDEIWGNLRFPFVADHKHYKRNGIYDFPNTGIQNVLEMLKSTVYSVLSRHKKFRKVLYKEMLNGMHRVLDKYLN